PGRSAVPSRRDGHCGAASIESVRSKMQSGRGAPSIRRASATMAVLAAAVLASPLASAQGYAAQWLTRVTQAARSLNYTGTVLVRQGPRYESFRLAHLFENGQESEKLLSLDGPAREIVRSATEVRYYFPDAKVVRVEPRTIR